MRILIYEWVTGGGLVGNEGRLPESMLREGLAMAQAAAADTVAAGHQPVLFRDLRVPMLHSAGGEIIEVASRSEHDAALEELATEVDAALLIAPETDRALLQIVKQAERYGAKLLSPGSEFVEIASDKQRTAETLASAVPMPEAIRLEPEESLPVDFSYPAVIKPLDGAGSQDTQVVAHAADRPPAYAWPRRLERLVPGIAASVAVLGVASGEPIALPPCRQRISTDGSLSYLGGSTPLAPGLAVRATNLALRAVRAMPPLVGYVGVDLILGDDPEGTLDVVIEINPRLTTSFVGLRRVVRGGLISPMIAASQGEQLTLNINPRPLAFDADGAVYWDEP